MLYPKFFHVRMTRRVNEIGMETGKARPDLLKQNHLGAYVHLLFLGQAVPPMGKLLRKLNLPFHRWNIAYELWSVNSGRCRATWTAGKWSVNIGVIEIASRHRRPGHGRERSRSPRSTEKRPLQPDRMAGPSGPRERAPGSGGSGPGRYEEGS